MNTPDRTIFIIKGKHGYFNNYDNWSEEIKRARLYTLKGHAVTSAKLHQLKDIEIIQLDCYLPLGDYGQNKKKNKNGEYIKSTHVCNSYCNYGGHYGVECNKGN
jgi:hypothetical protein